MYTLQAVFSFRGIFCLASQSFFTVVLFRFLPVHVFYQHGTTVVHSPELTCVERYLSSPESHFACKTLILRPFSLLSWFPRSAPEFGFAWPQLSGQDGGAGWECDPWASTSHLQNLLGINDFANNISKLQKSLG